MQTEISYREVYGNIVGFWDCFKVFNMENTFLDDFEWYC